MARPKSSTAQIKVRVPGGIKLSRSVIADAARAAQAVVDIATQYVALSKELAAKGIDISAEELASRAAGKKAPAKKRAAGRKSSGKRRRTVLSDAQRKSVVAELKAGATVSATAKKFKCSPQTVMTIKGKAGLVKKKTAKKKAAKRK